ncbi:MAG: RidA family protein [Christensenellales bacterium]|jgi:2-iminobutanoate/2-iminopropanoate deaminase
MGQSVHTQDAPQAIGPYSQAVISGGMVYTSGQIPLDPVSGNVVDGGIREQTTQVLDNLKAVLAAAGSGLDKVVKTTCFLTDMSHFQEFNTVYAGYFPGKPGRSCVAVRQLPKGVLVEVEAIAEISAER